MFALYYIFVLPLAWLMYSFTTLAINRKRASQMNLRVVMSPVDNINTLWIATQKFLIPLIKHLPFDLGSFLRYNHRGWQYKDQFHMHEDFGDAWVHTTPVQNQLYIANAEAVQDIFLRRRDFLKPTYFYKLLEIFGKNVNTVEGHDWLRHRRITAPPLNERNNSLVWAESLRQAREMLSWWTGQNSKAINTTDKDVRNLALNVLIGSVFGNSHSFLSIMDPPDPNFTMTFRDALSLVLENFVLVLLLPPVIISLPFAPKKLATIATATLELRRYMNEMLRKEKQMISQRNSGAGNLMSRLIKASDEERTAKKGNSDVEVSGNLVQGLSDSEIIGNVFLYNFAGHETTGNILSYAILLLAAHPEVQEWVAEEVRYVLQDQGSSETWDYNLFNRFKRCLAIMLETLRLYPSVGSITKYTNDREQSLEIDGEAHVIPPKTLVFLNSFAIHKMPRYWGTDSLVWRPSRWILSPAISNKGDTNRNNHDGLDAESILEPRKGIFMPWSDGPRACPGKKFSQVEFVAVIITLLRDHRVRPTVMGEEKEEDARQRILDVVEDSGVHFTLQMRHPTRAMVSWVLR